MTAVDHPASVSAVLAPGTCQVTLGGLLGDALEANRAGRLSHFITDAHSPAIEIFDPANRADNVAGDWYGEHAGKWLVAASRAAARSGDAALATRVREVTAYLVSVQEIDGYLGTYAASHRFMRVQPPGPRTWDGAPGVRSWDIWTHAYLVLGLLEAHRNLPGTQALQAAQRIGDLCWRTLCNDGIDITTLGNHFGMSATVLMDPACELFVETGEQRYLDLALRVLEQANAQPGLALLDRALAGIDAAEIGTGKAYQLAWNLVGLAKLHRATGRADLHTAVDNLWQSIARHHLTLGGGPWGGVGLRSREIFNAPAVFDPHGYVETCSTLAWIQLNRQLLAITGEAQYAEAIERVAYNDLLGAQGADGEDWCYYVFPNGRRVHTTYWRCCKSSGAMALEELPGIAYSVHGDGGADGADGTGGTGGADTIDINLLGPGSTRCTLRDGSAISIEQATRYPFDGSIDIGVHASQPTPLALRIRVPSWAHGATLQVPGEAARRNVEAGTFALVARTWSGEARLQLQLPMAPRIHHAVNRNVQESRAPDGSPVAQEVLHQAFVAVTRGPLVYATGLVDGYRVGETLRQPLPADADLLHDGVLHADGAPADAADGDAAPSVTMTPRGREPIVFLPYFAQGGRRDGAWRLTWLQLAPDMTGPLAAQDTPDNKNL